jgi:hypothetical protein
MAGFDELLGADGHHADAVFVRFDFFGNADFHADLLCLGTSI